MGNFWQNKRVICTGSGGFLGRHLVARLRGTGASVMEVPSADYDLRTELGVRRMFRDAGRTDIIFHLAATVGGIGANMLRPADFYYENVLMNALVVEFARRFEAGKFVGLGSVCQYPKYTPTPFVEANLWEGYPEETNAPYGLAKRGLLAHLQAARRQHGFNGIFLVPTNLYGPGDHDDPQTSHVVPALVRKIDEAQRGGLDTVDVWGTGAASRDFLYVEDCADALMLAAYRYNRGDPINLGSGEEVSIAALVEVLKRAMGFEGRVVFDPSRPDGQPRRCLNARRAWDEFGWKASTPLEEGLRRTVAAYRAAREEAEPCPA